MNRVLIVKLAAAGDVLLTTAMARALRRAQPRRPIAWLTTAYAAPLLAHNPDVDEILLWPESAGAMLGRWRQLWRWRRPGDVALLAHRSRRLTGFLRAAGFARIHAWDNGAAQMTAHRLELQAGLLRAAGIEFDAADLRPRLALAPSERAPGIWDQAAGAAPRWIVAPGGAANPWSRMPNRCWPALNFFSLATRAAEAGVALRWVGGREDVALCQALADAVGRPQDNLAGRLDQRGLAAVIATADLVIGNDSLPLVMAEALGRRNLGLYGPTDGTRIHAPGQPFLQGLAGCGPCYDPRAGVRGLAYRCPRACCMEQITVSQVWQVARGAARPASGRAAARAATAGLEVLHA